MPGEELADAFPASRITGEDVASMPRARQQHHFVLALQRFQGQREFPRLFGVDPAIQFAVEYQQGRIVPGQGGDG